MATFLAVGYHHSPPIDRMTSTNLY